MNKIVLGVMLVGVVLVSCSKKDTQKDQWNKRIKTAYQKICHKSIEPSMKSITNSEDGVWVYFTFKTVVMEKVSSAIKFKKIGKKWILDVSNVDKGAICK